MSLQKANTAPQTATCRSCHGHTSMDRRWSFITRKQAADYLLQCCLLLLKQRFRPVFSCSFSRHSLDTSMHACRMYNGASLGLARSSQSLMQDILLVKPTVLVSVPTLFQRIYDGVKAKVAQSNPLQKAAFNTAMAAALDRRLTLNRLEEL